jgi:hypothetical protein
MLRTMRFLVVFLGLAIVAYLGYRSIHGGYSDKNSNGTPKQRLENVQKAADKIEKQQEESAKRTFEETTNN